MKRDAVTRFYAILLASVILLFGFLLLGGYDNDWIKNDQTSLSSSMLEAALRPGDVLTQEIAASGEHLQSITVHVVNGQHIHMKYAILDGDRVLSENEINTDVPTTRAVTMTTSADVSGLHQATLRLTVLEGNDTTLFYGNMLALSRGMAAIPDLNEENSLHLNGQVLPGKLSIEMLQQSFFNVTKWVWLFMAVAVALIIVSYCIERKRIKNGKPGVASRVSNAFVRYRFMLDQLVSRSFKTKYKRSVLGVLWSLLNPVLTMLIQYIVFSTIFQSSIAYFPVYLLSGTICFSFFSEATTVGLSSISGNASLITKVYIPKYIFPISTVLSSAINFALTLIPLLATVLISGLPITRAYFYLPVVFICLLALCVGVSALLSTIMVFFRDMQFLWGVFTTLLVYITPLFYPESILPENLSFVFGINPLYHIIRIFRIILINGEAPDPKAICVCVLYCFAILAFGSYVFKRNQDKFVLNL